MGDDRDAEWKAYNPAASGLHWQMPLYILERHNPDVGLKELGTLEKLDMLDECGRAHWRGLD